MLKTAKKYKRKTVNIWVIFKANRYRRMVVRRRREVKIER
jgi:hypothetical protein